MAAPASPTLSTLTTEGLKRAGHVSPTAAQLTRAQDQWMEEIKQDVWSVAKKLKSLQSQAVLVTTDGQSRYALPSDYSSPIDLILIDGTNTGTAQAGTVSSITLQSDKSYTDLIGKEILITANTGKGSLSQVVTYDDGTKIAGVVPDFNTAPGSGSTYKIIDTYITLTESAIWGLDSASNPTTRSQPSYFSIAGDSDDGELILYQVPDKAYGLKLRYYADLMELDLASTLLATLYKRWRNLWINGVKTRALEDIDDSRATQARVEYMNELRMLMMREQYGMDLSSLQMTISDYG